MRIFVGDVAKEIGKLNLESVIGIDIGIGTEGENGEEAVENSED